MGSYTVNSSGIINNSAGALGFPVPSAAQTTKTAASGKAGTAITAGTGISLYSVTASKTFYLNQISVICTTDAVSRFYDLRDGSSVAGTLKYSFGNSTPSANAQNNIVFPVPIAFTTGVWLDISSSGTVVTGIVGYEQ